MEYIAALALLYTVHVTARLPHPGTWTRRPKNLFWSCSFSHHFQFCFGGTMHRYVVQPDGSVDYKYMGPRRPVLAVFLTTSVGLERAWGLY